MDFFHSTNHFISKSDLYQIYRVLKELLKTNLGKFQLKFSLDKINEFLSENSKIYRRTVEIF